MSKQPASAGAGKSGGATPSREAPKQKGSTQQLQPLQARKAEDPAVVAFVGRMRSAYKRVLDDKGKEGAKKLEARITAVIRDFNRESHSDDDGGFDFRYEWARV